MSPYLSLYLLSICFLLIDCQNQKNTTLRRIFGFSLEDVHLGFLFLLVYANGSAATRTVQLVHIYVPYVLWLKDQATRKGAVSVPTLRRLWTVSDSFKLR